MLTVTQIICDKMCIMQIEISFIEFQKEMSRAGLRLTKTRRGIFKILLAAGKPLTIVDIAGQLPDAHFVSVYRSVDALLRAGLIKLVPLGFKNRFELSDMFLPHHHHVTCESCGASTKVHDKAIEKLARQLTRQAGMNPTKHHFEAYGVCELCAVNKQ